MKYITPELAVLSSAVAAIQSSTEKVHHYLLDVDQQAKPIFLATSVAYEADE